MAIRHDRDRAALPADVPSLVRRVHASAANFLEMAITATVLGSTRSVG